MREVIVRPEAERDLDDIAEYTTEAWGLDHACGYLADLRREIEKLSETAGRHPLAELLFPNLRRMRCRHHLIFYLADEAEIDVVRVLHERMDASAQLVD